MRIAEILGITREYHVIIIGAGNIGRAVANYSSFAREGFKVQAMFDVSPALVGIDVHGIVVQPIEKLDGWLASHGVDIAVLARAPCGGAADVRPTDPGGRARYLEFCAGRFEYPGKFPRRQCSPERYPAYPFLQDARAGALG